MNIFVLLAQHGAADAAESPGVFSLNLGTGFWTVVIFLVLLAVLAKFAFPPILGYAEAREKRIQQNLDDAQRAREEAAALIEEHKRQLAEARQEAQQIMAESRQAAERMRQELLERTRSEQEEVVARASQDIERERARAVDSVRREAVDLAIAAAGRILHQRLGGEEDRRLVNEYLDSVAAGENAAAGAA